MTGPHHNRVIEFEGRAVALDVSAVDVVLPGQHLCLKGVAPFAIDFKASHEGRVDEDPEVLGEALFADATVFPIDARMERHASVTADFSKYWPLSYLLIWSSLPRRIRMPLGRNTWPLCTSFKIVPIALKFPTSFAHSFKSFVQKGTRNG